MVRAAVSHYLHPGPIAPRHVTPTSCVPLNPCLTPRQSRLRLADAARVLALYTSQRKYLELFMLVTFSEQLLLLGLRLHVSAYCARGSRLLHFTETFVGHAWFWA
eukprot:scaffold79188_cov63-Phaeocystis_antarctica.AAC.2